MNKKALLLIFHNFSPRSLLKKRRLPPSSYWKSISQMKETSLFFLLSLPLELEQSASLEAKISPGFPFSSYSSPFSGLVPCFRSAITKFFWKKQDPYSILFLIFWRRMLPLNIRPRLVAMLSWTSTTATSSWQEPPGLRGTNGEHKVSYSGRAKEEEKKEKK